MISIDDPQVQWPSNSCAIVKIACCLSFPLALLCRSIPSHIQHSSDDIHLEKSAMIPLPQVTAFNTSLVKSRPLVAVFTAGVAGIGNYALLELVKTHGSSGAGLRCYIIGRKDAAAAELLAECRRLCPKGDFRYVKAEDLTLLRCVDQCCDEILRLEREVAGEKARLDMLVMTQGQVDFGGRLGKSSTTESLSNTRLRMPNEANTHVQKHSKASTNPWPSSTTPASASSSS